MNRCRLDEGALLEIHRRFNIETMIDVGCGKGCQVEFARQIGIGAIGVDGDYTLKRNVDVIIHDYTTGPLVFDPPQTFDLAWSVEFIEHVEEQFSDNFMNTFRLCKFVIATYVPPERPGGYHHVNKKPAEYWIDKFMKSGFEFDKEVTSAVRENSTMAQVPWMKDFGLFFRKDPGKGA